jgi:translation initiation factor 1
LGDLFKQVGYVASDKESDPMPVDGKEDDVKPVTGSETEKVVIRKERKGRGGTTVTIIDGLNRTELELKEMAKKMRKRLGCGATVEGRYIVLQGNLVDRVKKWLAENEIKTIVS